MFIVASIVVWKYTLHSNHNKFYVIALKLLTFAQNWQIAVNFNNYNIPNSYIHAGVKSKTTFKFSCRVTVIPIRSISH